MEESEWWIDSTPPPSQHETPPWRLAWSDPDSNPFEDIKNVIIVMGRRYGRAFASVGSHIHAYIEASAAEVRRMHEHLAPVLTPKESECNDPTRKIYPTSTRPVHIPRVRPVTPPHIKTRLPRRR